jgi:hypothetical protein
MYTTAGRWSERSSLTPALDKTTCPNVEGVVTVSTPSPRSRRRTKQHFNAYFISVSSMLFVITIVGGAGCVRFLSLGNSEGFEKNKKTTRKRLFECKRSSPVALVREQRSSHDDRSRVTDGDAAQRVPG